MHFESTLYAESKLKFSKYFGIENIRIYFKKQYLKQLTVSIIQTAEILSTYCELAQVNSESFEEAASIIVDGIEQACTAFSRLSVW